MRCRELGFRDWGFGLMWVQGLGLRGDLGSCRPTINIPPPFKGPNRRIPIMITIKGKGLLIRDLQCLVIHYNIL